MINKTKVRRSFTNEEDRHLRKLVRKFGSKNKWNEISALMKTRDPRQCRDRWNYYLSPKNNDEKWTEEEDKLLFDLYEQRGRKWATFKPFFNGRTTVNIKSRWYFLNRNKHTSEDADNTNIPNSKKNKTNINSQKNSDPPKNIVTNNEKLQTQIFQPQPQNIQQNQMNFTSLHQIKSGQPIFISLNNQFLFNLNQNQDHANNSYNSFGNASINLNNNQNFFSNINQNIMHNANSFRPSIDNDSFDMVENFNNNYSPKLNEESLPNKKDDILDFDVNFEDFDEFINSLFSVNAH